VESREIRPSHERSPEKMPQALAQMLDIGPDTHGLWEPGELGTILEHQLAAPLEFELVGMDRSQLDELRHDWPAGPALETFGDLLRHPRPPVELLKLTKAFAKASRAHPDSPLPEDVAGVLYLASIVVALTRCRKLITGLGKEGLSYGLDWALKQTWLDESIRQLLEEGHDALSSGDSHLS